LKIVILHHNQNSYPMASAAKHSKDQVFNEPMVVFPLKHYENLMSYVEDIEDRLTIIERAYEPTLTQEEVDALFKQRFGDK
jgi:hypothetical protein